jgi:hypothetical protein
MLFSFKTMLIFIRIYFTLNLFIKKTEVYHFRFLYLYFSMDYSPNIIPTPKLENVVPSVLIPE